MDATRFGEASLASSVPKPLLHQPRAVDHLAADTLQCTITPSKDDPTARR
jgi:hypothetical protein